MTDDIAMIQTVDFFTPIVDDPYMFGQIAAANSLSDVWAMGGEPAVALNIVGFPNCLDPAILGDILAGGADKVKEAGAVLVGGHSVQDDEPKYGLCVSGFVHPDKIFKNVDFPAPFSPTSAWISPSSTCRFTLSSAFTPGNVLVIFFISNKIFANGIPPKSYFHII